jgi:hypothetical protein
MPIFNALFDFSPIFQHTGTGLVDQRMSVSEAATLVDDSFTGDASSAFVGEEELPTGSPDNCFCSSFLRALPLFFLIQSIKIRKIKKKRENKRTNDRFPTKA